MVVVCVSVLVRIGIVDVPMCDFIGEHSHMYRNKIIQSERNEQQ